jgi:hypothetical protein
LIGGKETVYNMMRPKISLDDLEKEEDREGRNLRMILQEEMEASYIGYAEDNERLRQSVVNATRFKDSTEALVLPSFDLKDEATDEDYQDEEQVREMI